MYSSKENINILTSLLIDYGVEHIVVCPGSRNAPIVHNFNESPKFICHPVTDERSAGFYALGMTQRLGEPVAVCVTSGTALLNLAPAVAETYYQKQPLVVVSADRPAAWIDQLDGQTLPQPDALGRFVRKAVSLPVVVSAGFLYQFVQVEEGGIGINLQFEHEVFHFLAEKSYFLCHGYLMNPRLLERIKSRIYCISGLMGISSSTRASRSFSLPVPCRMIW